MAAMLIGLGGALTPVSGQSPDGLGTRASGMAGAFVAIADDPSATAWNPAGLAAGAFFGAALDVTGSRFPRSDEGETGHLARHTFLVSVVTPPLGLSYWRRHHAGRTLDRPTPAAGQVALARLDVQQFGVTLVQSLADGVATGATVKFLRGTAATGVAAAALPDDVTALADALPDRSELAVDVDVGLHLVRGPLRLGLLVSSLARPAFSAPGGEDLTLDRQVRAGVAIQPAERWTLSLDADLREVRTLVGPTRHAAVGTEYWWPGGRVGVRGGVRMNTVADARPVGTFGASVAARAGLFLEGFGAVGAPEADRAWGLAVRAAF